MLYVSIYMTFFKVTIVRTGNRSLVTTAGGGGGLDDKGAAHEDSGG